jgi:hypothetical protein
MASHIHPLISINYQKYHKRDNKYGLNLTKPTKTKQLSVAAPKATTKPKDTDS